MSNKFGEIIDFHIHPYANYDQNMCMFKDDFNLSTEEGYEDLKNSGITHACGSVIIKETPDMNVVGFDYLKNFNREALKIAEESDGFITPGFHIHPMFVKESLEEIEFMHKKGVNLIGELVPYMHGWDENGHRFDSKALYEILDLAGQYGMIVSYHTMVEWQSEMEEMIKNNPKVTFVAAHPGQKADYLIHIERLKKYDNAYLDLSGTGLFRYGMLKYGVDMVGADKFLFGTDYPITNPHMYVQAVMYEKISDSDMEKIFSLNAKRLLSL